MIDLHCHILPGLDDGPRTLEQSLEMARMAAADGIRAIVASPHAYETDRPDPDVIRHLTARLNSHAEREQIPLTVYPGSEVWATPNLVDDLSAGRLLTVADRGTHVLVELPYTGYPMFVGELFFRLKLAGITPILAHVERYEYFHREFEALENLVDRGCLVQLNAGSLVGREGHTLKRHAWRILRDDLVTVLASDGHDTSRRRPVLSPAARALRRQRGLFEELTEESPRSILNGNALTN